MAQYYITNEQANALEMLAREHNESIDHFFDVTLTERFGNEVTAGTFINKWFEAQRLIDEQNFYEKGHDILLVIRAFGIDCKQNMQTNKLHCPELDIYADTPTEEPLFG